ncbi:MAG: peptidylprolyl isomerase [Paracoccaceae bacterium]
MLKRFIALPAFALASALSFSAQAQDASTVVATVNGTEITLGHMIVARATLPEQYQQLPDNVLFNGILDQLIQQTALADSFTGELPPRVPLAIENESRSLKAGEAVELILAEALSEEAINAAYKTQYVDQDPGKEYNASHILVETEENAAAIVESLATGADFAETAKEKSTGPSGPNGGSLGWFGTGAMVPEFEQAVVGLEVGQVSVPVQTQFGWHVIRLNETRVQNVPTLDEVRQEIEGRVREEAMLAAVEELVSKADVDRSAGEELDPAILQQLGLIE